MKSTQPNKNWRYSDTTWVLSLFGTAIGAGVLFLPIKAGAGGLIPLLVMLAFAFPMTFFAHRALCRFVLSDKKGDITDVVEDSFGKNAGYIITILYFLAIYPILLVYSVGITNTVSSFMQDQLGIVPPSRWLLSFILVAFLMIVVHFGEKIVVKIMSVLVYPFIIVLILIALALIPKWNGDLFTNAFSEKTVATQTAEPVQIINAQVQQGEAQTITPAVEQETSAAQEAQTNEMPNKTSSDSSVWMVLWLVIPIMIFSFNHSPIISSLAVAKRDEYQSFGDEFVEKRCSKIIKFSNIMMVVVVMFFVFSCALCLSPANLLEAKAQNVSILTYLANYFSNEKSIFFESFVYVAPIVAFIAISKSFFGHYLGAKEGLVGLVVKTAGKDKFGQKTLNNISGIFMFVTAWIVAALNPSILNLIDAIAAPVLAIILFLMPMYAIHKLPVLKKYRGKFSNFFTVIMGTLGILAAIYTIFA